MRVDAVYKALIQQDAVANIERQRSDMICALFANPTWDDEKNDRQERIRELNIQFNTAVELVYNPRANEPDIDWDNPFYAAAKRGLEKTRQKYEWAIQGKTWKEAISPKDEEQIRARLDSRKQIDQA